jgi:polyhydroxyalkanoate synthesis regulator phasin
MKRSTTVAALGLAAVLGITGAGVAVAGVAGPAHSTSAVSSVVDDVAQRIEDALSGLVDDGTITQEQASEVARTLAESRDRGRHGGPGGGMGRPGMGGPGMGGPGMGGPGMGEGMGEGFGHGGQAGHVGHLDLSVLTDVLGLTEDELRSALRDDGTTLADVAEQQGVAVDEVVAALRAAAEERVEQAVTDGRITREHADEIIAELPERIADAMGREWPGARGRHAAGDPSQSG